MESVSRVKAVVSAFKQYRINSSDANAMQLKRQMDILSSISSKSSFIKSFKPKDVLTAECLLCLVDIMNDPGTKSSLAQNTMSLLNNLANIPGVNEVFHSQFNLSSTLVMYLTSQTTASASDPNTVLCVKLLQKVTYNCKLSISENYIDTLINFIIKQLSGGSESELTLPCLGLLANLCRNNYPIQMHIKSTEDKAKVLLKCLPGFFSSGNNAMLIFTLSIYASVWLDDEDIKVFDARNINQVFQCLFHTLLSSAGSTRKYTIDLFVDLLKHTRVHNALIIYPHVQKSVQSTLSKLCATDTSEVSRIFGLLLSFCTVNGLRSVLCSTLLDSPGLADPVKYQQLFSQPGVISEPLFAIIYWASQSVDSHDTPSLLALDFLREIYEECVDQGRTEEPTLRSDLVLNMVSDILTSLPSSNTEPSTDTDKRCLKLVKSLQLLTTMCCDESLRHTVASSLSADMCFSLIDHQFSLSAASTEFSSVLNPTDNHHHHVEHSVNVVLFTLELMMKLLRLVSNMENKLCSLLQDVRIVPYLTAGLASHSRDRVQISLKMITRGATIQEFPHAVLGDSLAAHNCSRKTSAKAPSMDGESLNTDHKLSVRASLCDQCQASLSNKNATNNSCGVRGSDTELEGSVQNIIEMMQNGMELQDMKQSDIISVYEHRLLTQQTNQNQLQDLLDAKALALQQADRLISHYRCRMAQADIESQKLRGLLRDWEKKSCDYQQRLTDMSVEKESQQNDLEQMAQDMARLENIAEEHNELQQKFNQQTQRLEASQRALSTVKQEHATLAEMHDTLRRHNDTLKQQHETATQQLNSVHEEMTILSQVVKDKDSREKELSKNLSRVQEKLKKTEQEREEMEMAIDHLRANLSKAEQSKKNLTEQVTSLELLCRQHENTAKEKDNQLRTVTAELEKHRQIATLIHSLSSGKTPAT